jgi:hypothetical protein
VERGVSFQSEICRLPGRNHCLFKHHVVLCIVLSYVLSTASP